MNWKANYVRRVSTRCVADPAETDQRISKFVWNEIPDGRHTVIAGTQSAARLNRLDLKMQRDQREHKTL